MHKVGVGWLSSGSAKYAEDLAMQMVERETR